MEPSKRYFQQGPFDIRLEWGLQGIRELEPECNVLIIVDVLSFSTAVDVATSRGAKVYPYRWKDQSAVEFARSKNALLADFNRNTAGFSLSPSSLRDVPADTILVLPSPNGSTLSLSTAGRTTICGCLRNAKAVAEYAMGVGGAIGVIPAGERWMDGTLRPCYEDMIGAGAIISQMDGQCSPEAAMARSVFLSDRDHLLKNLSECGSGKELIGRGFQRDVELAAALMVSPCVPVLKEGAYAAHY